VNLLKGPFSRPLKQIIGGDATRFLKGVFSWTGNFEEQGSGGTFSTLRGMDPYHWGVGIPVPSLYESMPLLYKTSQTHL